MEPFYRPTKFASPIPDLVCDGYRDGSGSKCNAKDESILFTNADMTEKLIEKAYDKYGSKFLFPADVMDEPPERRVHNH